MHNFSYIEKNLGGGSSETYGVCPEHGKWLFARYDAPSQTSTHFAHHCPKCIREEKERAAWGRAGIPPRFAGKTIRGYDAQTVGQKKAKSVAENYARHVGDRLHDGSGLVFMGRLGTGKTHLACAIGSEAVRRGYHVLFIGVHELVSRVTETWKGSGSERDTLRDYTKPDLLIIDEVGGDAANEVLRRILFEVINTRYEQMKSTIIITNINPAGLSEYLGERAFNRLCDTSESVLFSWESHRGNAIIPAGAAK